MASTKKLATSAVTAGIRNTAPATMPSPAAIATIHSRMFTGVWAPGPAWISIQAPPRSTSATSPRSIPMPSTMSSTMASAIDLMSSARNGGDAIWARAWIAASSIRESPQSGRPGYGCGALRSIQRDGLETRREIGPVDLLVIETTLERRLHHGEIWRNVEIARRVQRGMPDLENLPARRAALHPRDLGQDRVAHELEGLGDQRRADQPGRIAGTERDHAPAPALRHRQGHQIAQQIRDVLHVVIEADARHRIGAHARAILRRELCRPAHPGVACEIFRQRSGDHALAHVGLDQHMRLALARRAALDRPDVERGMRPGRLRQVLDDAGDSVVAFDQQHVAGSERRAQPVGIAGRERLVAGQRLFQIARDRSAKTVEHPAHGLAVPRSGVPFWLPDAKFHASN